MVLDSDYKKAGFLMLPTGLKDRVPFYKSLFISAGQF